MSPLEKTQEEYTVQAVAVSPGIAIGRVYVMRRKFRPDVPPEEKDIVPGDAEKELARFHAALEATRKELLQLRNELDQKLHNGDAGIFDAHLMIVDDRGMNAAVDSMIRDKLKGADYAFYSISERYSAALGASDDEYLRERAADIRDVAGRVRRHLENQNEPDGALEDRRIVIAPELSPSETAGLDRNKVLGFAVETGSEVSHTAILARSMRLPALTGVPGTVLEQLSAADKVIIDGYHGRLIVHPEPRTEEAYRLKAEQAGKVFSALRTGGNCCETRDGFEIRLSGNIETEEDLSELRAVGAFGVGLMRSEYLFNRRTPPDEETQFGVYRKILTAADGRPVVIRTLDAGGDKFFDALNARVREANPFLGLRGVRLTLKEQKKLFRTQLRALLRAGVYGDLRIMIPMVTSPEEMREVRKLLEEYAKELRGEGAECASTVPLGVMIETPAAALTAEELAKHADFFSIGTNDLVQYTLAIDRSNDRVAYLYQPSHPAVLKLIARTAEAASGMGIPVSVCGQMAGDPRFTALLAGLGVHALSMDAGSVGAVRRVIRGMSMNEARQAAAQALAAQNGETALAYSRRILERSAPDLAALL